MNHPLPIGTKLKSLCGERATDSYDNEVSTGPDAVGTVVSSGLNAAPQLWSYVVDFPDHGIWVVIDQNDSIDDPDKYLIVSVPETPPPPPPPVKWWCRETRTIKYDITARGSVPVGELAWTGRFVGELTLTKLFSNDGSGDIEYEYVHDLPDDVFDVVLDVISQNDIGSGSKIALDITNLKEPAC